MAHYQNGQPPPIPPHQYPQRQNEDDAQPGYQVNGAPYPMVHSYSTPQLARQSSNAQRQNNEMFMAASSPPLPPPPNNRPHSTSLTGLQFASQSMSTQYNPQDYANPLSPTQPSPGLTHRTSISHAPYNPQDYAGSGIPPGSPGQFPPGFSPGYPGQAPPLSMPSGPLSVNTVTTPSSRLPTSWTPRTSQPVYPSHYTPPAPPPLPAIPGSAGDSPSDDWGRLPQSNVTRYTTIRRQRGSEAASPPPVPPPHDHSRENSFGVPDYSHLSNASASPGVPPPPPPHRNLNRNPSNLERERPLPRPPAQQQSDYFTRQDPFDAETARQQDLENEILNLSGATPSPRPDRTNGSYSSDDSDDPEALAGLAAMEEADRQDREDEARRQSGQSTRFSVLMHQSSTRSAPRNQNYDSEGSDALPVDLSAVGGGWDAHMSYGRDPNSLTVDRNPSVGSGFHGRQHSQTVSSSGSLRRSGNVSDTDGGYSYPAASVDGYGTGGLTDPTRPRRQSFDEGDEAQYFGGPPEIFYHPGFTNTITSNNNNRPLPPPPPHDQYGRSQSGPAIPYPSEYRNESVLFPTYQTHISPSHSPAPPRHTSLIHHPVTPSNRDVQRSLTDAEERRRKQMHRGSGIESGESTAVGSTVTLDLPGITKRYNAAKLSPRDFDRCNEPWALSASAEWLRGMVEEEQYLKKQPLVDGLTGLFTYKVSTMKIADAETLASQAVDAMMSAGTIREEEEWLFFTDMPVSGVFYQLTGNGCYSSLLHSYNGSGLCYSYHCQRTEKKMDLSDQSELGPEEDWVSFYKLKKEDLAGRDAKEVERQNILHEIVQKEENYLRELTVLLDVYKGGLQGAKAAIMGRSKLPIFIRDVFGKVDSVKKANEDHLLPQMKYRQKEQGPWVVGFSDIFREWIRKAKSAYIDYASSYPRAIFLVREEMHRNMLFRRFLEDCQQNPRSRRLPYEHYLKLPISRLQHLGLLLDTVLKRSIVDNDEKRALQLAIEEIKAVTHECDARVGDGNRKVALTDLQSKLKLRPNMQRVELNLDHLGRELIYQGELMRVGGTRFNVLETHAILFDHYFVLAKTVNSQERNGEGGGEFQEYDVSRLPIPMDLLILESRDDDPVTRGGIGGVVRAAPQVEPRKTLSKVDSNAGTLQHSQTSISLNSLQSSKSAPAPAVTQLEARDERIMYPFRIKHLGKETYTLFAPSIQNRDEWCNKIVEAKTKHAQSLYAQNAEPFKLRVVADSAFGYESGLGVGKTITIIKGTPLDRAVREVERKYVNAGRPGVVCRARVNCATTFGIQDGKEMVAVGTDFGVYVSEKENPRGWSKVITSNRVTQVAVLEEFSLFLLISDKSLIAYHLDIVCPPGGGPPNPDASLRRAPQKLSGSRDVGFFSTGRMKDRSLVLYKKRDGISSTFKVLEPVLQKSTEKRSRFPPLRSGKTEFFRDFDEFYIPTECMSINMFHSSLAIATNKGFEILTLDKKIPMSIPDLTQSHVAAIAQKLAGQKPLGMFRLPGSTSTPSTTSSTRFSTLPPSTEAQEFLLCYESCAVYVNKHGDISRSVIMEFVGKAQRAAMHDKYVLLFDSDFVEVRNAQNGRLRQVIAGRDVKCLDDGSSGRPGVKMSLQHPENERVQLLVELVLNEGLRE